MIFCIVLSAFACYCNKFCTFKLDFKKDQEIVKKIVCQRGSALDIWLSCGVII